MGTSQEAPKYAEIREFILDIQTNDSNITTTTEGVNELLIEKDTDKDFDQYCPLFEAAKKHDWNTVKKFIDEHPDARTAHINIFGITILHLAVRNDESMWLVEDILNSIDQPSLLEEADIYGNTALSHAVFVGNIKAATKLVEKNEALLLTMDKNGLTPLHHAARGGHKEAFEFILSMTKDMTTLLSGQSGATLLHLLLTSKLYGNALDILKQHMKSDENHLIKEEVLKTLAQKPQEFESGNYRKRIGEWRFSYWNAFKNMGGACLLFFNINKRRDKRKKDQEDLKLRQEQALELVKLTCKQMITLTSEQACRILKEPLFTATRLGIVELVNEIIEAYPDSAVFLNHDSQNIFQIAVLYRQNCVIELIQKYGYLEYLLTSNTDNSGNNILHLAGKLRLSTWISGATLPIQRELQWFKAIENILIRVRPSLVEDQNQDQLTPREVFNQEHKELVREGQEWMKNFAQSYSVVGALIITVTFAVAFTIPGGTKTKGEPNFLHNPAFKSFVQSDAISLIFSFISMLTCLGILTSRYSEEDFLESLPRKLMIGLVTMFISLQSMMFSFTLSLCLIFSGAKPVGTSDAMRIPAPKGTSLIILLVNFIPIIFEVIQLPLFCEVLISTYFSRRIQSKVPLPTLKHYFDSCQI